MAEPVTVFDAGDQPISLDSLKGTFEKYLLSKRVYLFTDKSSIEQFAVSLEFSLKEGYPIYVLEGNFNQLKKASSFKMKNGNATFNFLAINKFSYRIVDVLISHIASPEILCDLAEQQEPNHLPEDNSASTNLTSSEQPPHNQSDLTSINSQKQKITATKNKRYLVAMLVSGVLLVGVGALIQKFGYYSLLMGIAQGLPVVAVVAGAIYLYPSLKERIIKAVRSFFPSSKPHSNQELNINQEVFKTALEKFADPDNSAAIEEWKKRQYQRLINNPKGKQPATILEKLQEKSATAESIDAKKRKVIDKYSV